MCTLVCRSVPRAPQLRFLIALALAVAFALGMVLPAAFGQPTVAHQAASRGSIAEAATFRGRNGPIAFRSDANNAAGHESHAIWQVAPGGTGAKRITRGSDPAGFEVDYSPVFFADGRRFAYVCQIADRDFGVENQIYIKSVSAQANALGSPVLPAPVDYRILSLSVSPNGRQLALAVAPPPLEDPQIFTIGLDGGETTQLTSGPISARTPEFSPDGRRIVFARPSRGQVKGGLFTIGSDGTDLRRLTSRPGDGAPSYSPSGDQIVFNGHSGGHTRILSIRADGGGLTVLTHGPFVDRGPVFSPDGRNIAFSRAGKKRNPDLYVMRANGTGAHLLYASRARWASDFGPDWGPKPR